MLKLPEADRVNIPFIIARDDNFKLGNLHLPSKLYLSVVQITGYWLLLAVFLKYLVFY